MPVFRLLVDLMEPVLVQEVYLEDYSTHIAVLVTQGIMVQTVNLLIAHRTLVSMYLVRMVVHVRALLPLSTDL